MQQRSAPLSSNRTSRSGVAAMLVLICLSFATVVATLLIQAALAERTYAKRIELIYQSDWLVESGIDRAAAQIAKSSIYSGETWPVDLPNLDRPLKAVVHIAAQRTDDPQLRLIRVSAEISGEGPMKMESHKDVRVSVGNPRNPRPGRS
jgi:hypothetical protein